MNRRDGVWRWRNMLSTFVQESFGSTALTEHASHFSSWRPVEEGCSSADDIHALEKIPGPSRDVPKSDGDHIALVTSVLRPPQKKQTW